MSSKIIQDFPRFAPGLIRRKDDRTVGRIDREVERGDEEEDTGGAIETP